MLTLQRYDETSQWKRPKFDPSSHQNPLTDLHQNFQAWLYPGRHPACTILQRSFQGFCSQIRDFAVILGWLVFCSFFWLFNKATAYTPGRIFTQNTSNNVVPGKEVPFGGPDDYILYLDPWISEKPPFRGPILTGLSLLFLRAKTALTWGCSNVKLPLIVIVAP